MIWCTLFLKNLLHDKVLTLVMSYDCCRKAVMQKIFNGLCPYASHLVDIEAGELEVMSLGHGEQYRVICGLGISEDLA